MKIFSIILIIIAIGLLSGCGGCETKGDEACKKDPNCLNIYKPCPEDIFGCLPDGTIFTECRTKTK